LTEYTYGQGIDEDRYHETLAGRIKIMEVEPP
jgi:hypothetical protein